ncbi:MAG: ATP-binding protein [Candidatus Woesearchaeota archaeon]
MDLEFTVEDVMEELKRGQQTEGERKARVIERLNHDLKSPANGLELANFIPKYERLGLTDALSTLGHEYAKSCDAMAETISAPQTLEDPLLEEAARDYRDNLKAILAYLPDVKENRPGREKEQELHTHLVDSIEKLAYAGNTFFGKNSKEHFIDQAFHHHAKDIQPLLDRHGIALDYRMETRKTEGDYVGNVLKTLLDNTVDHAFPPEQEDRQITIRGKNNDDRTYTLLFSDNGKGIDTNHFNNPDSVFGYRESSRAGEGDDHGKGLYLAKAYVEERGGTLEIERTAPDEGTTFKMTIPPGR